MLVFHFLFLNEERESYWHANLRNYILGYNYIIPELITRLGILVHARWLWTVAGEGCKADANTHFT